MATYCVTLPVIGLCVVEVEAESRDEAINKALDSVTDEHLESWGAIRQIVRGNVFMGDLNEAHAEEV